MRIIAGKFRGTVLNTFDADNIRPTADRAREGIFNKIQFIINGADVLDLFGGTGAISIEFISRGANKVITCDNNSNSVKLIKENFKKVKTEPNIIIGDYVDSLHSFKSNMFDIIFLDPPFATNFGFNAIEIILQKNLLKEDGIIIFEHSSDNKFEYLDNIELFDSKKYGYITVDFLRVKND